jgi:hypothetical protein
MAHPPLNPSVTNPLAKPSIPFLAVHPIVLRAASGGGEIDRPIGALLATENGRFPKAERASMKATGADFPKTLLHHSPMFCGGC